MRYVYHGSCLLRYAVFVTLEGKKRPPGGLEFQASTGYLLSKAGSMAKQRWMRMLAQVGVNPSQFGALMALREAGPAGQQHLSELIGIDPRNVVPIIETLVGQGLVSRETDPADRRRRVLGLTERGRAVVRDLESVSDELEDGLFHPLTAAEQVTLRRMLIRLLEAAASEPG
jgi:MarR family transcriptional regulator, temperature-dependent positive regulator of motility